MEQEIHITLRFNLATGNANFNEIVYELKEFSPKAPGLEDVSSKVSKGIDQTCTIV